MYNDTKLRRKWINSQHHFIVHRTIRYVFFKAAGQQPDEFFVVGTKKGSIISLCSTFLAVVKGSHRRACFFDLSCLVQQVSVV